MYTYPGTGVYPPALYVRICACKSRKSKENEGSMDVLADRNRQHRCALDSLSRRSRSAVYIHLLCASLFISSIGEWEELRCKEIEKNFSLFLWRTQG